MTRQVIKDYKVWGESNFIFILAWCNKDFTHNIIGFCNTNHQCYYWFYYSRSLYKRWTIVVFSVDYSKGFGGKYGVQTDRVDKSAAGYDSKETVALHSSQTDSKRGFGGKFGVDDRRDEVYIS